MSGTMDEFGDRNALLNLVPTIFDRLKTASKSIAAGQIDIFSLNENKKQKIAIEKTPLPDVEKVSVSQALEWEKELLGIYFSSHPLDTLEEFFESKNCISLREALEKKNHELVILGVMVNKIRKITTRKGEVMAFLMIEDKTGSSDAVIFPRTYQEMKENLVENKPILIAAKINVRDGDKSLVVEKARYVEDDKRTTSFDGVTFRIRPIHTEEEIAALKKYISNSNGDTAVRIIINDGKNKKTVLLKKRIEVNSETKKWLKKF